MIRIGRLNLTLPENMKDRAGSISRHVAKALAATDHGHDRRVDHIGGLNIGASAGQSDREIGCSISTAIMKRVGGSAGGGDD